MTLREIADALERDRHEPDKVLCYVQSLRRMATDQEQHCAWTGDPWIDSPDNAR